MEVRQTLSRALDKVEAQGELINEQASALADAKATIERAAAALDGYKKALDARDGENAALHTALDAETALTVKEREGRLLAEGRATSLEKKLEKSQKRNKIAALAGFVIGVAARAALPF